MEKRKSSAEMLAMDFLSKSVIKFAKEGNPFQQSSQLFAPLYVYDQEIPSKMLGLRKLITVKLMSLLTENYGRQLAEDKLTLAAASTGSCPWGSFVAQSLNLPLVVVRSDFKSYGLHNIIEGEVPVGNFVLLIDDVVFTGSNSLRTIKELQKEGNAVLGTIAIMDMQIQEAVNDYKKHGLSLNSLFTFSDMMNVAECAGVPSETIATLEAWHQDPFGWSKRYETEE